jgi:hypothetical protein
LAAKRSKLPYRLVKVEWEDSARPIAAWQWISDYELPQIVNCISVGFLIAETKQAVAIAPNLGDIGEDDMQASGIIRIPRSAIKKLAALAF